MACIQVAISLDTTGSMSGCLQEIHKRITEMIQRLMRGIPGLQLAIIAHGDYDTSSKYVTQHLNFTQDEAKLVSFVQNVEGTSSRDPAECYELVLRLVRTELAWRTSSEKILVMIGDAYPHPPGDPQNEDNIDWENEARLLARLPVRIYGAQFNKDPMSTEFFSKLTGMTGGSHLQLSECSVLYDVIVAIFNVTRGRESLKNWENMVRANYGPNPLPRDLQEVFETLHRSLAKPAFPTELKSSPNVYAGKDVAFVWGGKLTPSDPLSWKEPADVGEEATVHKLHLKQAVLGPEARAHEANIVQMETTDFQNIKITLPIVHMVGAKDSMVTLDLIFNTQVTFRLVSGAGPVYLVGQHVTRVQRAGEEEWARERKTLGNVSDDSSPNTADKRGKASDARQSSFQPSRGLSVVYEQSLQIMNTFSRHMFGLRK